jgi:hypothetical protein
MTTLRGDGIVRDFIKILDDYVENRYGAGTAAANKAEFATRA